MEQSKAKDSALPEDQLFSLALQLQETQEALTRVQDPSSLASYGLCFILLLFVFIIPHHLLSSVISFAEKRIGAQDLSSERSTNGSCFARRRCFSSNTSPI
jgi:hypothetical protein